MSFSKYKRTRISRSEPHISIGDNRFQYGATVSKMAELSDKNYVVYFVDEANRQIGFKFLSDSDDEDAYMLSKGSGKKNSYRSAAQEVINDHDWIKAVHQLKDSNARTFKALNNSGMWVIKLRPSFEEAVKRSSLNQLDKTINGIYRYRNLQSHSKDTVYIGKGNVYARAKNKLRLDWKFDLIEYSRVENEEDQFQWEHFWINQFKINNNGSLPIYNLQSGNDPTKIKPDKIK